MHVVHDRVLLWRSCDRLCTFGFPYERRTGAKSDIYDCFVTYLLASIRSRALSVATA